MHGGDRNATLKQTVISFLVIQIIHYLQYDAPKSPHSFAPQKESKKKFKQV